MPAQYVYVKPGVFTVVGFCYGKVAASAKRGGKVKVTLVRSGRWTEAPGETKELRYEEIASRTVTATEALDGAGTFVGGVICTSRVPARGARVWDYGVVVGYRWDEDQRGSLDVNFNGTVAVIAYEPITVLDVAVEIYALRPCMGKSVSLVMPQELRQKHEQVYNKFNGVGQVAVRESTPILEEVGEKRLDETELLPLLDITSFEVSMLPIHHILDYVYYKDGGRSPPDGVLFGESIFDQVQVVSTHPQTTGEGAGSGAEVSDGLSESEEDSSDGTAFPRSSSVSAQKRRRITRAGHAEPTRAGPGNGVQVPESGDIRLQENLDQLISLRRPDAAVPPRTTTASSESGQFQPTTTQTRIHVALINDYWRKFGFFPHPAVLRALFGWDFGTRGLSLAHFTRMTEQERRVKVRKFDMSNFSKKNKLPTPTSIATFSALEAFAAAATFLGELQVSDLPTSESALAEITAWVDDRLELFRVYVSEDNWTEAAAIKNHFSASHESFVRVYQLILRQDVANALRASKLPAIRDDGSTRGKQRSARIPLAVRKALPKQGEKQICLRFMSAQGCRGKNGKCIIDNLCHFKPAALPDVVRDFIDKNYGGLSTDMQ